MEQLIKKIVKKCGEKNTNEFSFFNCLKGCTSSFFSTTGWVQGEEKYITNCDVFYLFTLINTSINKNKLYI